MKIRECFVVLVLVASSFGISVAASGAVNGLIGEGNEERTDGLVNGLHFIIEADKASYGAKDQITIRFEIQNQSNVSLKFVPWKTPLESRFSSNMFEVKRGAQRLTYIGKVVRRAVPRSDQYIVLSPGESRHVMVNLSDAYDLIDAGRYTLQFRSELMYLHDPAFIPDEKILPVLVQSNQISFELSQARNRRAIAYQQPAFAGCTSSHQDSLNEAHSIATNLSLVAKKDMLYTPVSDRPSAARYQKWFGSYSSTAYAYVSTVFDKIYDSFENEQINYLCDCDVFDEYRGVLAYVYPNQNYDIHICDNTFSLDVTGTDTQAGTIIHEVSHFFVVGSTIDAAYGESASLNLALNNPAVAITNAENYLFFAENFPAVAMPAVYPRLPAGKLMGPALYLLLN